MCAPSARYEVWNGGYALLAAIVNRVADLGDTEYCRSRLFKRAGLKRTGFTGDDLWADSEQAVGYAGGGAVWRAAGHSYGDSYG